MTMHRIRFIALLLPLVLAACMTSKRPLFDATSAVTPIAAGIYGSFTRQDDGSFKRDAAIRVERHGHGYNFTNKENETTPVTLHPLREATYIVQASGTKGDYNFIIFHVDGANILVHAPDCEKQNKDRIAALGAKPERLECKLDGVTDPPAFFAMLDLGPPIAKLMPEK